MTVLFGKKKIEGKTAEEYEDVIRCYDKTLEIYPNHESAKNNKEIAEEKLKEQQRTGKEKKKAHKETSDFIFSTESKITAIKSSGIKISK